MHTVSSMKDLVFFFYIDDSVKNYYLFNNREDYGSDLFHITVLTCQKKQVKTVI